MSRISGECWQLILLEQKQFYNFQIRNISRPVELSSVIVFVSQRQYWLNTEYSDNICPGGGEGSVKYPSNNERPLGPLFLASFPTRDWVFVGGDCGEVLLSLIGAGTSGLCQMLLAPLLLSHPAFVNRYQILQTTDTITRLYAGEKTSENSGNYVNNVSHYIV